MLTNLSMSLVNMLFNVQLMKYAGADGVIAYGIIMYVGFIFTGTYLEIFNRYSTNYILSLWSRKYSRTKKIY